MGVTDAMGEVLGIPEPSARFFLALFSAYPFALVYRWLVCKQGPLVQNLFFTVSGLWVVYFIYGVYLWHTVFDTVCVYLVLMAWGGTLLGVTLTWIITMSHLLIGYLEVLWLSDEVHPISWTIPHCVLVLKLVGLAYNLYDAQKKPKSMDLQKNSVATLPPFLEVTGFSYFCGSVLAGPQMSFVRYHSLVHGKLFDIQTTPSSVMAGVQRLSVGVAFAMLYSIMNGRYPISYLSSEDFAEEAMLQKLWLVFISGKVALWRYVTVWLIAEGSCIVTGISYNGVDERGRVDWHALANIHLLKFEAAITLQGVVDSFNINTNQWMAWYVFKRLRWLKNKNLSYIITLTYISFWHGLSPGYFLNFMFEFVGLMSERTFISTLKALLGRSLWDLHPVLQLPLVILAYVAKNLILMYPVVCFMLLSWHHCFKFMSSVYFYGHVVLLCWFLTHSLLLRPALSRPHTKED